jgi:hypothetical protein
MMVSLRKLAPVFVASAVVAGGVWIESGLAQPETAPPSQPGSPPERPRPGRQPGPGGPGQRVMTLDGAMRMINRGFRELSANVADPAKREENLSAVWMMQQGCAAAKRGKPEHLEGDPVAALEEFRRGQIKLMGMLIELEAALMDNKNEEAVAILDEIHEHEEASHEKYEVDEDEVEGEEPGPDAPGDRPPPARPER